MNKNPTPSSVDKIDVRVPIPLHRLYESQGLLVPDKMCQMFGWESGTKKRYLEVTKALFEYIHAHHLSPEHGKVVPDQVLADSFGIPVSTPITFHEMGKYLFETFSTEKI